MNVLVIGGTAFIGPHVVRKLAEAGHTVAVFHRGRREAGLLPGVSHIHGDRRQLAEIAPEFERFGPEVVLHMIPSDAQHAWSCLRAFTGLARRAVAISSIDVYRAYNRFRRVEPGPPEATPLAEDAPLRERLYPYRDEPFPGTEDPERRRQIDDYDKIPVERLFLSEPQLPGTVLRLPAVYGPNDEQHRLFKYLRRMDDRRPAILLSEGAAGWRWARGYVENVAQAIFLAVVADRAAGRVYNVAEPEALSEAEWVRRIAAQAGWDGELIALPEERLPGHLKQDYDWRQDIAADTTRIRTELGYTELIAPEEALRRTIAWERANPGETDLQEFDYAAEDAALAEAKRGA
jgi:nucleoside-diphosphate-sugar epimerase